MGSTVTSSNTSPAPKRIGWSVTMTTGVVALATLRAARSCSRSLGPSAFQLSTTTWGWASLIAAIPVIERHSTAIACAPTSAWLGATEDCRSAWSGALYATVISESSARIFRSAPHGFTSSRRPSPAAARATSTTGFMSSTTTERACRSATASANVSPSRPGGGAME